MQGEGQPRANDGNGGNRRGRGAAPRGRGGAPNRGPPPSDSDDGGMLHTQTHPFTPYR